MEFWDLPELGEEILGWAVEVATVDVYLLEFVVFVDGVFERLYFVNIVSEKRFALGIDIEVVIMVDLLDFKG